MSGLQAFVFKALPPSLSLSKAQLGHFDTETIYVSHTRRAIARSSGEKRA
jgi:hypothetical protein